MNLEFVAILILIVSFLFLVLFSWELGNVERKLERIIKELEGKE